MWRYVFRDTVHHILKKVIFHTLALVILVFAAGGWWRLWMYHGALSPLPILHSFIESDGGYSYQLTMLEMFIHLVFFYAIFILIKQRYSGKNT
jgi:hypothetical protein